MVPVRPEAAQAARLPLLSSTGSAAPTEELQSEVVTLFEEHRSRLLGYIVAFGISAHDAEEIIQEVFLALFRHLQLGRSRRNLRGWIFRVAHNLALKQRQSNRRWQHGLESHPSVYDTFADPAPNPEEHAVLVQRHRRLLSAVDAMSEHDQWCLRLRAEGLRYREIAGIVGISLGSVANSLARSLARLMRAVEL